MEIIQISELLSRIHHRQFVVPEFQREYVWTLEQAKQLFDSLLRSYPVGGLLLWKTDNPPELKQMQKMPKGNNLVSVLLDGQQRLTALYMLITADIPWYYSDSEIRHDPRSLCVNIKTLDFEYYHQQKMKDEPYWIRVTELFDQHSNIDLAKIAESKADQEQMTPIALVGVLIHNMKRLTDIKNARLPVETIPDEATVDEAIDIFDRINTQGTKLTDAELALTHVTAKWPEARREMKAQIENCTSQNFKFDLTFMTRSLTTVVTHRASFKAIHQKPLEELKPGWSVLTNVMDYLINILPNRAFIHSTDDLNTNNALVPLVAYLCINNGMFPDNQAINCAVNWLHTALIRSRYTDKVDQRLEKDLQLIFRDADPWMALRDRIAEQCGRADIKPSEFTQRGIKHPLYKALFILVKARGAMDWFNGVPLGQMHGDAYCIHSHHIFPKKVLYDNGWDKYDHTHINTVNEIANRAFLTAKTNSAISTKEPADYLPGVNEQYPESLKAQLIPDDQKLWEVQHYRDFLAARRELISRELNEFMNALVDPPEETHRRPITEIIRSGESHCIEFKSSLQWDLNSEKQNIRLRYSSLKTIAAFLNSEGGTLLIGVADNGEVLGLENDFNLIDGSRDKFVQLLSSLVADRLGETVMAAHCQVRFEALDGRDVFIIDISHAFEPVFLKTEKGELEFFVRIGNMTRALDQKEASKYIKTRWS